MNWTCGECPAKVREDNLWRFTRGTCGWIWDNKPRADSDPCPASLAEMEAAQARYLCMWGYACYKLADAITARRKKEAPDA